MKYRKPSLFAFLLAFFSLLAPLSLNTAAGAASRVARAGGTGALPPEKISHELRARLGRPGASAETAAVILQLGARPGGRLKALLNRSGVHVRAHFKSFDSLAVRLPLGAVEELASFPEARFVSADGAVRPLGHVTATTGADAARGSGHLASPVSAPNGSQLDGSGVGIAVVDSGMDVGHKAFASRADLSGNRVRFRKDFTADGKADRDPYGHGTHVASSAAGVSTVPGGLYEGVAKGADLINLRVLDATGQGRVSDLLAALDWILSPSDPNRPPGLANPSNAAKYNIRVVNLSLGAPAVDSYRDDPVCKAVRALVDAGVVVVAAAGNNGRDASGQKLYGLIHSPGDEPSAITVGATNTYGTDWRSDDGVTSFSSRGPTRGSRVDESGARRYDNLLKPDLSAPGNRLIYAEADEGGTPNLLVRQNPQLDAGLADTDNRRLMYLSGTSMAAPVVAGAAALLLQANPRLTPGMVKMILMYTAQPLAGFNTLEQGAGQLNVEGAVRLAKLVRADLTGATALGSPLLNATPPEPVTAIAGHSFPWAQGVLLGRGYATGDELVTRYQKVYGQGWLMGDGILTGDGTMIGDGILMGDGTLWTSGILMSDRVSLSDGSPLGGGTPMFGTSILFGDGVMISDSILFGDGILMSDSMLFGDSILFGDANLRAQSALVGGDDTDSMK